MSSSPEIRIFPAPEALFQAAAQEFARTAADAVQASGGFKVALSGGSTPKSLYTLLTTFSSVSWDKVSFFWGDERQVPPDHRDSNYRMAYETLLSKVPVKPENIFRVPSENSDATAAAAAYEQTLRTAFHLQGGQSPQFDLVLLGMGPDGHTASLFPGTRALHEQSRLVVANWVEKFNTYRITLTLPVLNNAASVMFLVSGSEKASALAAVFDSKANPEQFPAKMVQPSQGRLIWLVDQEAARLLPEIPKRSG